MGTKAQKSNNKMIHSNNAIAEGFFFLTLYAVGYKQFVVQITYNFANQELKKKKRRKCSENQQQKDLIKPRIEKSRKDSNTYNYNILTMPFSIALFFVHQLDTALVNGIHHF